MKQEKFFALLYLAFFISGCGDVADTLGLGRNPPDEFAVVDRPPLALPPDYDLRPPRPGAPRPQEAHTSRQASVMLFGPRAALNSTTDPNAFKSDPSYPGETRGGVEKALLESAGADRADPGIREIIDREASQKITSSRHLVDELLWWRKKEPPATTVDAAAEAERIKEAKNNGEPLNKGATPVIERKKRGWLGS